MLIVKKSALTGKLNEMDIPVTEAEIEKWRAGGLIQDVLSHLSADQREFLMTGSTPEEWDEAFREE